ncbi:MAG: hypothetical protein ACFHX7_00935 [Pseudomonadota bacterium]
MPDISEAFAGILVGLTLFSILTVVLMITLGVRMMASIPPDYFSNDELRKQKLYLKRFPPLLRPFVPVIRNALGLALILIGALLLVLPGQGLLTMLAGLVLLDFPGKYDMERWLVRRKQVRASINWMRTRAGQPPLELD